MSAAGYNKPIPGRTREWPAWSVFALALIVALVTGLASQGLAVRAANASRAERIIVRVREQAVSLETFEPVGTFAEGFSPDIAQELRKQMQYIDFLMGESLEELSELDPEFAQRGAALREGLAEYQALSLKELRLSIAGKSGRAQAQNDALVASLGRLRALLDRTSRHYEEIAQRANRMAVSGSLFIILLGAVAIGTLFWRFERTRRIAVRQKARFEARFSSLVQNSADGIALTDAEGTILYASASVERILGYAPDELIGRQGFHFMSESETHSTKGALAELMIQPGASLRTEMSVHHADGSERWVELDATNLLEDPNVEAIVANFRDISDRKRLEGELTHQAFHDSLTGLANRALFSDRVEHARSRARRYERPFSVLVLDLDDFKTVNDSLGHEAGDSLLQEVAARILHCLRESDTAARLGGDEFAILLEEFDEETTPAHVAERLAEAIAEPFTVLGREVFIKVSIGIASCDRGQEPAENLLRNADLAMYTAKSKGKGGYELFEDSMHLAVMKRLELEAELRNAIENGELTVFYQPVLELESGRVVGAEALARWRHPKRGLISPADFIPLAEETGLIVDLGKVVLRQACLQARKWQTSDAALERFKISVNLSPAQILKADFVAEVATVLRDTEVPPDNLILEITEGALLVDTEVTIERLHQLKELGVRLAIDDFGTGYSSLSYLKRFPIDILKIDKSFVDGVTVGREDRALAQAVIKLGETLELETVAEGIETDEQMRLLGSLGCGHGQGFYFAAPLEVTGFDELLVAGPRVPASFAVGAARS